MRDEWLDRLRATAILSVVVYHSVQMSPVKLPIVDVTTQGKLGVDLFFVLSGWLIGTLFWNEMRDNGHVQLWSFWRRRWWRTLPAYYVALLLSWLAVFIARHEPFKPIYLLLCQNYMASIPFFLVSWSLCIEEHFYLFLPLLAAGYRRTRLPSWGLVVALAVTPSIMRLLASREGVSHDFGFYETATHLRMEGLVLGFWASMARVFEPALWPKLQKLARWSCIPLVLFASFSVVAADERTRYVWSSSSVALAMTAALVGWVGSERGRPISAFTRGVALISYSVYLTHPIMIHVARAVSARLPSETASYFVVAGILIPIGGTAFYLAVEKPSLRVRELFVPRRTEST